MSRSSYDVLIVGARCAGASLATFLARSGASVLVVDRDRLPSDHVLSTHTIHPPGIDVLDRLGVGEALRAATPATRDLRLEKDGAVVDVRYAAGRAEYCPRRERLDALLQDAARAAGAELCDRTRVTSLIREGGRVVGVRAARGEEEASYRATLVVGADGRHSTIARLAGAREYLGYDAPRAIYWGYWEVPPVWYDEGAYPFDLYLGHVAGRIRFVFQTDGGELLVGSLPPLSEVARWRRDPQAALLADLAASPVAAPLVAAGAPREPVRGTFRERFFFREAAGPGWVLVGDAGHHKEFVTGDGITEALLQAESLAGAIGRGRERALERWWRERDVRAVPLYVFGRDEGAAGRVSRLQRTIHAAIGRSPELRHRISQVLEHQVSPLEVVPGTKVLGWALAGALHGRLGLIPQFLAAGRRASASRRELTRRHLLLAALERTA